MTHQDLKAIQARADAALPAPWDCLVPQSGDTPVLYAAIPNGDEICVDAYELTREQVSANLEFCAHARSDVPRLLKYVAELEAALHAVAGTDRTPEYVNPEDDHIATPREIALTALGIPDAITHDQAVDERGLRQRIEKLELQNEVLRRAAIAYCGASLFGTFENTERTEVLDNVIKSGVTL
jgi:hypothetical protein